MTNNLTRRGPRTSCGKRAVAANSTTHGILSASLLRCKKLRCFYISFCPIAGEIDNLPRGSFCPVEAAVFCDLSSQYEQDCAYLEDEERDRFARELALIEIQSNRCDNAIALTGGSIIRESPPEFSDGFTANRGDVTKYYRYKIELLSKRIAIVKQILSKRKDADVESK